MEIEQGNGEMESRCDRRGGGMDKMEQHHFQETMLSLVMRPSMGTARRRPSRPYAPIGCDTQRAFMKWSRTSYDSKKEHSRTGENEKGIQNPQV